MMYFHKHLKSKKYKRALLKCCAYHLPSSLSATYVLFFSRVKTLSKNVYIQVSKFTFRCSFLCLMRLSSMRCSLWRLCSARIYFPGVPLSSSWLNPVEELLSSTYLSPRHHKGPLSSSLSARHVCAPLLPSPPLLLRGPPPSHVFNGHPHAGDLMHTFPARVPPLTSPTGPTVLRLYLRPAVLKGLCNSICPNPNS